MSLAPEVIYHIVKQIPVGKVATYGQIAALAGYPRHSRHVGRVLSNMPKHVKIPWHRVVNSQGKISLRGMDGSDEFQYILLEDEGVNFGLNKRISLKRYQWGGEGFDLLLKSEPLLLSEHLSQK
jgi:methylated-DNA-protein-cysteine methyltransferase related protein